ncbi:MAG TPA: cell division FtsA domain-containing protein, partial [Candidatus Paceibacterota bacterium]|nr:cell division FtsA domain-containing protein [Candidatus Paceibacterota bacterium]
IMSNFKIDIIDLLPDAVSASSISLNDRDIYAGCALINIGNDTTSMTVYNNGALVHVSSYPIGSSDITNDIALYFQIDLEEAENLKNGTFIGNFPQRKIDDIVYARLEDIFRIANKDLKILNLEGLLPAGVNLTGEGSLINGAEEIAKKILKVPVRIASAKNIDPNIKIKDVSWYPSYGFLNSKSSKKDIHAETGWLKEAKASFKNIFGQLLP